MYLVLPTLVACFLLRLRELLLRREAQLQGGMDTFAARTTVGATAAQRQDIVTSVDNPTARAPPMMAMVRRITRARSPRIIILSRPRLKVAS